MALEGVTLGGAYSPLQLLADNAWYGWHWLVSWGDSVVEEDEGPLPPPACIAAQASSAGEASAPQPALLQPTESPSPLSTFTALSERHGLRAGEGVACHLCCLEVVRQQPAADVVAPQATGGSVADAVASELAGAGTGGDVPPFSPLVLLVTSPYLRHRLSAWELAELLSPWTLLSSTANVAVAVYALMVLTEGEVSVSSAGTAAFAFGAFLQWLTLAQYLRHQAHFYIVMRTLARGTPALVQFLAGVVPIFLACVVFGAAVLGVNTTRFDGVVFTSITLFAVRLPCLPIPHTSFERTCFAPCRF